MGNSSSVGSAVSSRFHAECPTLPPVPSDAEVCTQFDELLHASHVAGAVAEELSVIESAETKWMYICLSNYLATPEATGKELLDPRACTQEMLEMQPQNESGAHDLFRAVRINTILRSKDWIDKLGATDGVNALLGLLEPSRSLPISILVEVVSVLFALSHCDHGISNLVQNDTCCKRLVALYTTSSSVTLKIRLLKLLGIFCCHNQATQGAVLRAIEELNGGGDSKYVLLANSFMQSHEDRAFQVAVLCFINVVINTTPTSAERMSIREDLEKNGLVTHLKNYQTDEDSHAMPGLLMQIQTFLKNDTNDRAKTTPPLGVQRRLSLSIPSASDEEPVSNGEPIVSVEVLSSVITDSGGILEERTEAQPTPQPDGPRSLQTRKSLKLEISELHTETDEVAPIVSPPPAPEPIQRRPSGSILPSLSIPKVGVEFIAPKSVSVEEPTPQPMTEGVSAQLPPPSLEAIVSMLQHGTKALDPETNQKLLHVLASLANSLTTEGSAGGGKAVVKKLEQSLVGDKSPDRISLKLPVRCTDADSLSTPAKPTLGFFTNPCSRFHTEATTGVIAPQGQVGRADDSAPRSPAHSHTEEEHSPRRSMTETESCDESFHEYEAATRTKSSSNSAKLALAGFFQHLKKGQGLPMTPAPTPMATASVKKDAKRPVFPSFTCGSAAPSPMPQHSNSGHFGSLPPLTPLKPSLSLPPLTPVRPQMMASPSTPTPIAMLKSPRANDDHLEPVTEEEETTTVEQDAKASVAPDISKFRKLLSMGAPKAAVRAKMQQAGVNPDLLDSPEAPQEAPLPLPSAPAPRSQRSEEESSSGPDVSKFRKLLTMGAPMAAVKAKMVQAGLDPNLLDQDHTVAAKAATPAPAPSSQTMGTVTTAAASTADDPVAKFRKLLVMGAPIEAVKAKMRQAGADPSLLDRAPSESKAEPAQNTSASASATAPKDDPEYAKFFKLRSMGAPAEAVKAKMRQAGLNPDFLDTPDAVMPSVKGPESSASEPQTPLVSVRVKDDPEYAKFFKLQSMGAPAPAVKAKMVQAGLNPELLDTPDALLPPKGSDTNSSNNNAEHAPKVLVKDHPEYAKFFKLKTMAPIEAVKAKMRQVGLNPDLLDTPDAEMPPKGGDETGVAPPPAPAKLNAGSALATMFAKRQGGDPSASDGSSNQSAPAVLVKDDPAYAKFFKLVAMGAPPDTVKGKMQMAGLKPELLDTPDAPLNAATGSGNQATNNSATGAPARRANLTLSIKPPTSVAKPTTRPFYWQQMKGDSIRGTIWEEIENDHAKENNQLPVFLADTELAQLESEFPAQTAPMTGPNKQTRSLSMDQMPKELMSPRVVFLIDRSRANNISIIIKQFRMSHAALREAIMKVDANVLNIERVQGLIKILPTDEEVASIMGYQGDPLMLNEAERVLKELISVPRLKQRLMAMQSKLQFPTFVRDLQQKVEKLRCASAEVAQSVEFKMILLVVLQVGNRMNQGTARGGAKGFRLGDLTKLVQLKSADKTTTLLHYVARMIRQKKGNAVRLSESLSSLYDVQNIPIPELPGDMSKISEIVEYISNELGAQKLKNAIEEKESCDHFVKVMSEFIDTASVTTKSLKDELEAVMKLLKDTMQRFGFQGESESGEESSSAPTGETATNHATLTSAGEFFLTIYEFSVALTKADRENEVKRLREEARAKQSQKAKTPALGPRSMSSRDVLRKPSEKKPSEDGLGTGPEATEPTKAKGDKPASGIPGPRVSPMLRQRSASLSAIVENNIDIATVLSKPPGQASITKPTGSSEKQSNSTEKKSTEKAEARPSTTTSKKSETPETKPSAIKPPTKIVKLSSSDKDKGTLASAKTVAKPVLTVPGKIVKTTTSKSSSSSSNDSRGPQNLDLSVDYDSPLGLTMPLSLEKPKSKPKPEFEEDVTPFDMASIEEIRAQLAKKHVVCEGNNNSELQSTS